MIIDYRCQIMSGINRYTNLGHFSTWGLSLLGKTDRFKIFIGLLITKYQGSFLETVFPLTPF